MPAEYIPILIFAALAAGFPAITLVLFRYIRPDSTRVGAKLKPYECGIPPEGDTHGRYSVRFYIVAILFVIFDVETVFLFPWAVVFLKSNPAVFYEMLIFIAILFFGVVYGLKKGVLTWR